MKSLIRKILREQEEEIETIPSFAFFGYDWKDVLDYTDGKKFRMPGDVDFTAKYKNTFETTLGGLVEVGGSLDIIGTDINSLGELTKVGGNLLVGGCKNLTSLEKLEVVDGFLQANMSNIISLGNLKSVGRFLSLAQTPIAETMSEKKIRAQVDVGGNIYLYGVLL